MLTSNTVEFRSQLEEKNVVKTKGETFKAVYGKEVDHLKNKSIYEKHIRKFFVGAVSILGARGRQYFCSDHLE